MSEKEKKEKHHKTKITLPSLLVILSCLCFIRALMPLWIPTTPAPPTHDYFRFCAPKIINLGAAMLQYTHDHDGKLPKPSKWCDLLIEEGRVTKRSFKCPGAKSGPCNYAMNRNLENIGRIDTRNAHSDMVLLFETYPGWNQVGGPEISTTANHKGKFCAYMLTNLQWGYATKRDLHKLKWKPDEARQE